MLSVTQWKLFSQFDSIQFDEQILTVFLVCELVFSFRRKRPSLGSCVRMHSGSKLGGPLEVKCDRPSDQLMGLRVVRNGRGEGHAVLLLTTS